MAPSQPGLSPISRDTHPPSPTSLGCCSPASPQIPICTMESVPRDKGSSSHPSPHPCYPPGPLCPLVAAGIVSGYQDKKEPCKKQPLVVLYFCPELCFLNTRVGDLLAPNVGMRSRISPLAAGFHVATCSWCSARSPFIPPCLSRRQSLATGNYSWAVQQVPSSRLAQTRGGENKIVSLGTLALFPREPEHAQLPGHKSSPPWLSLYFALWLFPGALGVCLRYAGMPAPAAPCWAGFCTPESWGQGRVLGQSAGEGR